MTATGKSVIGIGGTINSGNGQVVLDAVFPDVGLTSANISSGPSAAERGSPAADAAV